MNVIHLEKPKAIVVSLGGQTAINLAEPLSALGVPIIGTDTQAIKNADSGSRQRPFRIIKRPHSARFIRSIS